MSSLTSEILLSPPTTNRASSPPEPTIPQLNHHRLSRASSLKYHQDHHFSSPILPTTLNQYDSVPIINDIEKQQPWSGNFRSKKREVYRFQADWLISSVAWSNETSDAFQLAISSYIEEYGNQVQIIQLNKDDYGEEIESLCTFEHPYPVTKILWNPKPAGRLPQLIATTADDLRLWRVETSYESDNSCAKSRTSGLVSGGGALIESEHYEKQPPSMDVKLECSMNRDKGTNHCAPFTSFDWNDLDPSMIVTSSVDTTCTVFDIETGRCVDQTDTLGQLVVSESPVEVADYQNNGNNRGIYCNLRNQILAHNHEVYDVSFSKIGSGRDVFVSAGGDGSVRLFDLRQLSTSTMLYESDRQLPADRKALVRVCCNKQDPNFVSAFAINSKDVLIMDVRRPGKCVAKLSSHTGDLNGISWAPHSAHHLCSASEDHQALIWELSKLPNPIDEPLLAYRAGGKINTISWSAAHSDWIAIGFENYLELLRV